MQVLPGNPEQGQVEMGRIPRHALLPGIACLLVAGRSPFMYEICRLKQFSEASNLVEETLASSSVVWLLSTLQVWYLKQRCCGTCLIHTHALG